MARRTRSLGSLSLVTFVLLAGCGGTQTPPEGQPAGDAPPMASKMKACTDAGECKGHPCIDGKCVEPDTTEPNPM